MHTIIIQVHVQTRLYTLEVYRTDTDPQICMRVYDLATDTRDIIFEGEVTMAAVHERIVSWTFAATRGVVPDVSEIV